MVKVKLKKKTVETKVLEEEKEISLEEGEMVLLISDQGTYCVGIFNGVRKAPSNSKNQSELMTFKNGEAYNLSFSYPLGNRVPSFQKKYLYHGGQSLNKIEDVLSGKHNIAQYLHSDKVDKKYRDHALLIANFRDFDEE